MIISVKQIKFKMIPKNIFFKLEEMNGSEKLVFTCI